MKLVSESRTVTVELTDKEFKFMEWCFANSEELMLPEQPKVALPMDEVKAKQVLTTISIGDKLPF